MLVNHAEATAPLWHVVTRHSDRPDQVIGGIESLGAEATFRLEELRRIRARAERKAEEAALANRPGEAAAWRRAVEAATTSIAELVRRAEGRP